MPRSQLHPKHCSAVDLFSYNFYMGLWARIGDMVYEATEPANEALVAAAHFLAVGVINWLKIVLVGFGLSVFYLIIKAIIGF